MAVVGPCTHRSDGDTGDRAVEVVRDVVLARVGHHAGRDRERAGGHLGRDGAGGISILVESPVFELGVTIVCAVVAHPVRMGLRRLSHPETAWGYAGRCPWPTG